MALLTLKDEQGKMEALVGRMDALLTRLEGLTAALGRGIGEVAPSGVVANKEQIEADQKAIQDFISKWQSQQREDVPIAD